MRLRELIGRLVRPGIAWAHCDLPCGVYDPAQARIEAESVAAIIDKYLDSTDELFRQRCVILNEQRAELVKHHLWVLWTDYFKPEHLVDYPNLHTIFWNATKTAGEAKRTMDPVVAQSLLDQIAGIQVIFSACEAAG